MDLWAYAPDSNAYTAAGVPDWLDEIDLVDAPPHLRMGTHTLASGRCLRRDQFYDSEVALRNRLLDEQHGVVFASLPSADDAATETQEIVASWALTNGLGPLRDDLHPLEAAGRAVQEDLCLMVKRDGGWHLDAAVLCFPSIWSLTEKLGRPMAGVHQGVPHYDTDLDGRVDRFFDRLTPGRAVWRRNLSLKPYPLLFLPMAKLKTVPGGTPVRPDGSPYWLRTEFQTLQTLPRSGAILFTIKLQLAPLGVLRQRPDRAASYLAMLESWDGPMHDYKSAGGQVRAHVMPWLRSLGTDNG
jgi:dimethylamine monooxygenase subunit A